MRSPGGGAISMVTPSSARALPAPKLRFTADTIREAVVKSASCRFSMTLSLALDDGTERSTMAPDGIRPPLGALTEIREPSRPDAPKPLTTRLPWAIA